MATIVNNIVNSLSDRIVCYNNMVNEMKKDIVKNLYIILDTFEKKNDDNYPHPIVLDFNQDYFKKVNMPSNLDGYCKEAILYDTEENNYYIQTFDYESYGSCGCFIDCLGYDELITLFNELSLYLEYKELN